MISVEKILRLSGIYIKGIMTIYILKIMGVFLFDPQFDEFILVSLFVYMGGGVDIKGIMTIYILKIMGVFLFDPQFDEFILVS